jgi:hypothetical protein
MQTAAVFEENATVTTRASNDTSTLPNFRKCSKLDLAQGRTQDMGKGAHNDYFNFDSVQSNSTSVLGELVFVVLIVLVLVALVVLARAMLNSWIQK